MKLGELFIDLGVNSGGAFNTLSGFAFKLTNISQLAEKASKTVQQVFGKDTAVWAQNISDMAQKLSLSQKNIQAISLSATKNQASFQKMIGSLEQFQKDWFDWQFNGNSGFLDKYKWIINSPKEIMEASNSLEGYRMIIEKIAKISNQAGMREKFKQGLGIDVSEYRAFADLFNNWDEYQKDPRIRSDKEIEQYKKLNTELNELSTNFSNIALNLKSDVLPQLIQITKWMNELAKSGHIEDEIRSAIKKVWDGVKIGAKAISGWDAAYAFGESVAWFQNEYGEDMKKLWGFAVNNKYNNMSLVGKAASLPLALAVPGVGEYATGSLLGEGVTTAGLNMYDYFKKKNDPAYNLFNNTEVLPKLDEEVSISKKANEFLSDISQKINEYALFDESKKSVLFKPKTFGQMVGSYIDPAAQFESDEESFLPIDDNAAAISQPVYNDNGTINIYTDNAQDGFNAANDYKKKRMNEVFVK